ncbi:hypothetical protein CFB84_24925 [Burkholderia aenigmatica]|uniref:Uncharacterized protein n=1 Tax=Burkholderia aenigmatica TaxID=2015348 RepID=A0A228IJF6_9BURK|nr:hypothetical protein CFB84_24925 [Burkholderia aenigmatica]
MENAEHVVAIGTAVVGGKHSIVQQRSVEVPDLQAEDRIPVVPELDKALDIERGILIPCRPVLAQDLNQIFIAIDFI